MNSFVKKNGGKCQVDREEDRATQCLGPAGKILCKGGVDSASHPGCTCCSPHDEVGWGGSAYPPTAGLVIGFD